MIAGEPNDEKLSRWVLRAMEIKLSVSLFSNEHHISNLLTPIYYSGSTQQSVLSKFYYALKKSASLTIAHRNSKRNANWTFKKYGRDMVVKTATNDGKEKVVKLFVPKAQKVQ